MKGEELPATDFSANAQTKTCKFCGEVLKHISPCGDERNADLCLHRQGKILND